MKPDTLSGKICFVYGLGDANMYTSTFTNSVVHLAEFIKLFGGTQQLEPLRVNRFYFERDENEEKIAAWARLVAKAITS
jgi:flavodoxin